MDIIALVLWVLTAGGGFVLLGTWLVKRRDADAASRIGPGPILAHFLLAAGGLVVWLVYTLIADEIALAWAALIVLVVVAAIGFLMFARWLSDRREPDQAARERPEQQFPLPVVVAHGLFGAATLVLVALTVFNATGS